MSIDLTPGGGVVAVVVGNFEINALTIANLDFVRALLIVFIIFAV